MTSNLSPVIHIGFPKSGSTWLQEIVFKAEHGFYTPQISLGEDVTNVFTTCNAYTFNPTWARSYFEEDIKEAVEEAGNLLHYIQYHLERALFMDLFWMKHGF